MPLTSKLRLLQYDNFPRYCLKMAAGTGKTKIISLAIAWQYFNAVLEGAAVSLLITIRRLHKGLQTPQVTGTSKVPVTSGNGVIQLDMTATPRYSKGSLFTWSHPTLEADKTVFNLVAADNKYEKAFAAFLQNAPDVARFAKIPERFGFTIAYTDSAANLRYYEPDFVAVTTDGVYHLIETKGREDVDVKHKDRAAQLWCENATRLTGTPWAYKKVLPKSFDKLQPDDFADLIALEPVTLL